MERSKRNRRKKKKLLGSHQRCWVWGRNLVLEILDAGRWSMSELHLDEALPPAQLNTAEAKAVHHGVTVLVEPGERLKQLCHTSEHQGYLAKMLDYPYADADELVAGIGQRETPPFFAILDSVQDPYNFGALLRSAEVLGVDAVFIGERDQVGVTSMVARSSSGAVNRIAIARVGDLCELAVKLRDAGVTVAGASDKGEGDCCSYDFTRATALVLGNEGAGISRELLASCDELVRIPQYGKIESLNVGAAAAVLFYEASRQRHL